MSSTVIYVKEEGLYKCTVSFGTQKAYSNVIDVSVKIRKYLMRSNHDRDLRRNLYYCILYQVTVLAHFLHFLTIHIAIKFSIYTLYCVASHAVDASSGKEHSLPSSNLQEQGN